MPYASEVGYSRKGYFNRKGYFAIVCQMFVDAQCHFLYLSANHSGGTHDALIWSGSAMLAALEAGMLPSKYFLIADEAFPVSMQMLTPYSGRDLPSRQDSFNFHLSRMRQVVERAFGQLIRRFGIFWRPLVASMDKWSLIVSVTCKLHNVCIDAVEPTPDDTQEDAQRAADVASAAIARARAAVARRGRPAANQTAAAACPVREAVADDLERNGFVRPGRMTPYS